MSFSSIVSAICLIGGGTLIYIGNTLLGFFVMFVGLASGWSWFWWPPLKNLFKGFTKTK